jgi:hypothetical protein
MDREWTDKRVDDFAKGVDRRFEQVDARFDRFERSVDRRFDKLESKIDKILWLLIGGFVTVLTAIATKLLLG